MEIWTTIRRLAPALDEVERIALAGHRDGLTWPDVLAQVEPELFHLVGFAAADPRLRATGIYMATIRHLASAWAWGRSEQNIQEACPVVA